MVLDPWLLFHLWAGYLVLECVWSRGRSEYALRRQGSGAKNGHRRTGSKLSAARAAHVAHHGCILGHLSALVDLDQQQSRRVGVALERSSAYLERRQGADAGAAGWHCAGGMGRARSAKRGTARPWRQRERASRCGGEIFPSHGTANRRGDCCFVARFTAWHLRAGRSQAHCHFG